LVARHFVGAVLEIVHGWIEAEIPYLAEEIIRMFRKLTSLDRDRVMGIEQRLNREAILSDVVRGVLLNTVLLNTPRN
jgi:hypothetical protein